jgi:Ser/Thr protein kinase RdoA (MazF antagonist)
VAVSTPGKSESLEKTGKRDASREAANEDPIAAALARYPILTAPQATPITRGLMHQTFRIDSGAERYVLQRLNPIFSLAVHENIEAVTARLEERGVLTPRLCRTAEGELYADLGEAGRFRLMTYVVGESFDTCASPELAAAAGRLVARFHSALDGLEHAFAPLGFPFHEPVRHFADLEQAIRAHPDHRHRAEVVMIADRIREAAARWQPLDGVPDRVVHLDLKFNNVLFASSAGPEGTPEARCLIDLDTLSRRPLWIELGDAWRSWCNRRPEHEPEAQLDARIFEAAASAWLGACRLDLSRAELESLAHAIERLTLELCARFAADALNERYFGWNERLFESAGDHNLSRARGQLSMHAQALETRADRLRFLLS